ncbi:MAG: ribosome maturation factor RimM [Clostridia bacterium]|nr:ribosome maturation factor RimM [Clostridia bacterium]
MEKIVIGKIVAPIGIKGEVKVMSYSDDPARFSRLEKVYVGTEAEPRILEHARVMGRMAGLKLKGTEDRNAAEGLRGAEIQITEEDLPELPEGTYYVRDLIGLQVIDDASGEPVGRISDVIQNTAQDIYAITLDGSDLKTPVLVPAVAEFIRAVDVPGRTIRIHFIPGMISEPVRA